MWRANCSYRWGFSTAWEVGAPSPCVGQGLTVIENNEGKRAYCVAYKEAFIFYHERAEKAKNQIQDLLVRVADSQK